MIGMERDLFCTLLKNWFISFIHILQSCIYDVFIAVVSPVITVEPRFHEVLGVTNDFLQPNQNFRKVYGTEPRFDEIFVITNTINKRKLPIQSTLALRRRRYNGHPAITDTPL